MTPQEKKKFWLNALMQIVGGLVLISTTYALTNKTNKDSLINEAKKREIVKEVSNEIKPELDLKLDKSIFEEHEKMQEKLRVKNDAEIAEIKLIVSDIRNEVKNSNADLYDKMFIAWEGVSKRIDAILLNEKSK